MTRRSLSALSFSQCTVLMCAMLVLSACAGDPWVDTRREGGSIAPVGESSPDRVAICHAGSTDRATLMAMAARECAKTGRAPHYAGTVRLQCRLITPNRSYFDCR